MLRASGGLGLLGAVAGEEVGRGGAGPGAREVDDGLAAAVARDGAGGHLDAARLRVVEDRVALGVLDGDDGVGRRPRRGELSAVLGPSGAGKTTLLRALVGDLAVLDPDRIVLLAGRAVC